MNEITQTSTKKKIKNHLYQVNQSLASSSPPLKNKNKKAGLPWWLSSKKIFLPMQDTRVQSLIQEDPTSSVPQLLGLCSRAREPLTTELTCHDYGTLRALEPEFCNKKPPQRETCTLQLKRSPCSPQPEKSPWSNKDPAQSK